MLQLHIEYGICLIIYVHLFEFNWHNILYLAAWT